MEGRVLGSPSIPEMAGANKISNKESAKDTAKTRKRDANVTVFAPFLSPFAMHSETSFIDATGKPDATMEQHTAYKGEIREKRPSPAAPINLLKNMRYAKPISLVIMFAPDIKTVL